MGLPATGSTITMNQVQVFFGRASGLTASLRATLGPFIGITTGTISLSASFGGYTLGPTNTVLPTISGTVAVGNTLTSTTGTWTGTGTITYTRQWQRGTTNISGATSSTYVVQSADIGNTLRCVITATDANGPASANTANTITVPAPPVNTAIPTISGTVAVGNTLTSTTGTWTGTPTITYAFQWQRGTTNISGATNSTYVIQSADGGSTLRCRVVASNSGGTATAFSANTITLPVPSGSQTFNYVSNADQTFTVPSGVSTITVKMWGAGGGSNRDAGAGGGGGYTTTVLSVTSGEALIVRVGRGGLGGGNGTSETTSVSNSSTRLQGGTGGWPGGGTGGSASSYGGGGGGGGYTGIFRSSTPLAIAGGGGGGGDDVSAAAGGGTTGGSASGGGGTQSAGGSSSGSPTIASGFLQGAGGGTGAGGGGGGGYYGGGNASSWSGGGGGSGYFTGSGSTTAGSGVTPGNSGDADRGTAGQGAPQGGRGESSTSVFIGIKGRNGLLKVSWG